MMRGMVMGMMSRVVRAMVMTVMMDSRMMLLRHCGTRKDDQCSGQYGVLQHNKSPRLIRE
jgi:hypothetical protein